MQTLEEGVRFRGFHFLSTRIASCSCAHQQGEAVWRKSVVPPPIFWRKSVSYSAPAAETPIPGHGENPRVLLPSLVSKSSRARQLVSNVVLPPLLLMEPSWCELVVCFTNPRRIPLRGSTPVGGVRNALYTGKFSNSWHNIRFGLEFAVTLLYRDAEKV